MVDKDRSRRFADKMIASKIEIHLLVQIVWQFDWNSSKLLGKFYEKLQSL